MDDQQIHIANQLLDHIIALNGISSDLLNDPIPVQYIMHETESRLMVRYDFIKLCSLADRAKLTHCDVLQEEMMMGLHLEYGFPIIDLSQWLRLLDDGSYSFFMGEAKSHEISNLDIIEDQANSYYTQVKHVLIESKPAPVSDLATTVQQALNNQVTIKQYNHMLRKLNPTNEITKKCNDGFIKK